MGEEHAAYQVFVGVDVAAETFVAAWLAPGGKPDRGADAGGLRRPAAEASGP